MIAAEVVLALGVTLSQVADADAREAADIKELTRLEQIWNDAHERGDAEALDRLWADDFVVSVPSMRLMNKADALGMFRGARMKFQQYQSSDLRVRLSGDAAVVTGRLQRTRVVHGKNADDDWRFTKTDIRRGGTWRVVAFHASPAAPNR